MVSGRRDVYAYVYVADKVRYKRRNSTAVEEICGALCGIYSLYYTFYNAVKGKQAYRYIYMW